MDKVPIILDTLSTDPGRYPAQARWNCSCSVQEELGQECFGWVIKQMPHHCERILRFNMESCNVPFLFLSLLKWTSDNFKILGRTRAMLGSQSKKNNHPQGRLFSAIFLNSVYTNWPLEMSQTISSFFPAKIYYTFASSRNYEVKRKVTCILPWISLYQPVQFSEKEIHYFFFSVVLCENWEKRKGMGKQNNCSSPCEQW